MVINIGFYCIVISTLVAFAQGIIAWQSSPKAFAVTRSLAVLQFVLLLTAFCSLIYAYVTSDFSVANVTFNSSLDTPLLYKVAGAWSNHEGSMLLWLLLLALFTCLFALAKPITDHKFNCRVLAVQGLISFGFHLFVLFASNPLLRFANTPKQGLGLNPLLEDPILVIHPPILYVGYVGLSLAFSFAIAALLTRQVNPEWARALRPWATISWSFLTAGIALGSWWAYYELGWGGWWFWDPVENAALMPWLTSTALIHTLIAVAKRSILKNWALLLAIASFGLSLIGTFLTRSGVLSSVHNFAADPARGIFILVLLSSIIGAGLIIFAFRFIKPSALHNPISREGSLYFNNLMLSAITAMVFIGTLYPLGLEAITGETISVGAPYFNTAVIPFALPIILVMAIAPFLGWQQGNLKATVTKLMTALVASMAAALGT